VRGSRIERTRQHAPDGDVQLLEDLRAERSLSARPEPRQEIPGDLMLPFGVGIVSVDQDIGIDKDPRLSTRRLLHPLIALLFVLVLQ